MRFAPAPTGFLHVGGARTALFNWLFARGCDGEMLLRIEDTDAALKTQAYVDAILEPLQWLGIDWDSGPHFQSDRRQEHEAAIESLLASGHAYYCDLTREEVEQRAAAAGLPAGYYGWSRDRDVGDGPGAVIRFRCPDSGVTVVDDVIRGQVGFRNETLEDFVVRRSDGSPMFHLANAVDDHGMGISHVIRGEDLLNTTPRVLLLWEALGYGEPPAYAHLPLLVNSERQKLSKRRDDVSVDDYRRRGYLPEAMVNYLAMLGWRPPDGVEVRPLAELVELFDLTKVKPGEAFFDQAKLTHFNAVHLRALTSSELAKRAKPFLRSRGIAENAADSANADAAGGPGAADAEADGADAAGGPAHGGGAGAAGEASPERAAEVVRVLADDIQQRVTTLSDVRSWVEWIIRDSIDYEEKAWSKAVAGDRRAAEVLAEVRARLADDDFTSSERLEAIVMGVGDELSERSGVRVLSQAPVRVAVTGSDVGLPLWKPLMLLGRDKTLARLRAALKRLSAPT